MGFDSPNHLMVTFATCSPDALVDCQAFRQTEWLLSESSIQFMIWVFMVYEHMVEGLGLRYRLSGVVVQTERGRDIMIIASISGPQTAQPKAPKPIGSFMLEQTRAET